MTKLSPLEQAVLRMLPIHDAIYQKTGGWIGHRAPGMPPSLLLHTVGAKTGQPRTSTPSYARDGDSYLIVASNAGSDRYPALVSQSAQAPRVRNQHRPEAIRGDGAADHPRGRRLPEAVAARQQEQCEPVQRLPAPDIAAHPDLRVDRELVVNELAKAARLFFL
jgi:deazaflavin-dependent oxidoreductase (nitroreductase family)